MPPTLRIGDRWAVRLAGETMDLQEATQLFRSGGQIVRAGILPDQEAIVLLADEFERLQEPIEVHDAAERILNPLNAALPGRSSEKAANHIKRSSARRERNMERCNFCSLWQLSSTRR